MKRFDYLVPQSLDEALQLLARQPEAAPLAGGTNILVQMKEGHRHETALLSLKRLPELRQLSLANGRLTIGAALTMKQLAAEPVIQKEFSALATAAGLIGSVQTRNVATIGGNICNASPSADSAAPLLAFGTEAVIIGQMGQRVVPLDQFFIGPGQTALQPGELLQELVLPLLPPRSSSAYARHIPRAAMDISVAGTAVALTLDDTGAIAQARVALCAVAPTPMRAYQTEKLLIGQQPTADLIAVASKSAAAECQPMDDVRASVAYRRHLISVLTRQALQTSLAKIANKQG